MRQVVRLNQEWLYLPKNKVEARLPEFDETGFHPVTLPHTNVELPWHNFNDQEYQFVSWYRRHVNAPQSWQGKRLLLQFDGVMIAAKVWVNGKPVGEHKGGYTPFTFDVTDAIALGRDNVIAVCVDSRERTDIPPFGNVVVLHFVHQLRPRC